VAFETSSWRSPSSRSKLGILIQGSESINSAAHVRDSNNIARLLNSRVAGGSDRLEPLYGADSQLDPNFPETWADVAELTSEYINLYEENSVLK